MIAEEDGASRRTISILTSLLVVISFAVYVNAIRNGFVTDDHDIIEADALIRDIGNIPAFFALQDTFRSGPATGYYRPLSRITYVFDHYLWGLNPAGYHFDSILLHAAVAVAFFLTAGLLFNLRAAFIAAVLFALHPINVEAVAWIAARNNILSGLFILLSLNLYIRFDREQVPAKRTAYYLLSLLLAALALFSKEFALMLPGLLFLYQWTFGKKENTAAGASALRRQHLATYVPYIALAVLYLAVRHSVVGASGGLPISALPYNLLLSIKSLFTFLQVLALPVALKGTYFIPTAEPFLNARGVFSIITAALAAVTAVFLCKKDRELFFALAFLILFFLPVSGIIAFSPVPVAERYAYIMSMGFCLFCAIIAARLAARHGPFIYALVACLAVIYAYQTIQRIRDWKDDLSFAISTVREMPTSPVAFYLLGNAYRDAGNVHEAIDAYKRSIEQNPYFPHSHLHLALVYTEREMWDDAMREFKATLTIMPNDVKAHEGLAYVYYQKGLFDESIEEVNKVLELDPTNELAGNNLRALYEEKSAAIPPGRHPK